MSETSMYRIGSDMILVDLAQKLRTPEDRFRVRLLPGRGEPDGQSHRWGEGFGSTCTTEGYSSPARVQGRCAGTVPAAAGLLPDLEVGASAVRVIDDAPTADSALAHADPLR